MFGTMERKLFLNESHILRGKKKNSLDYYLSETNVINSVYAFKIYQTLPKKYNLLPTSY